MTTSQKLVQRARELSTLDTYAWYDIIDIDGRRVFSNIDGVLVAGFIEDEDPNGERGLRPVEIAPRYAVAS